MTNFTFKPAITPSDIGKSISELQMNESPALKNNIYFGKSGFGLHIPDLILAQLPIALQFAIADVPAIRFGLVVTNVYLMANSLINAYSTKKNYDVALEKIVEQHLSNKSLNPLLASKDITITPLDVFSHNKSVFSKDDVGTKSLFDILEPIRQKYEDIHLVDVLINDYCQRRGIDAKPLFHLANSSKDSVFEKLKDFKIGIEDTKEYIENNDAIIKQNILNTPRVNYVFYRTYSPENDKSSIIDRIKQSVESFKNGFLSAKEKDLEETIERKPTLKK